MGFAPGTPRDLARRVVDAMILAIETAVECVGVALGDHRGAVAHASVTSDRRHAESLAPMIEFVLAQAGVRPADLAAVAVDTGPGLFTGMRVGIATAQALAWSLEIPLVPVCSLDVLACRARTSTDLVATALDARRSEVYWALHKPRPEGGLARLGEPAVGSPDDLVELLADRAEPVLCIGTGVERHSAAFGALAWAELGGASMATPDASDIVAMAASLLVADGTVDPAHVQPAYLRAPDAEINWDTRTGRR